MVIRHRFPFISTVAPVVAAAGVLLAGASVHPAAAPKAVTHTVVIEGARFQPDVLTVKPGESVVWINRDFYPHTATARTRAFDSHRIEAGKSWSYTATSRGEFPYVCALHPTMRGVLKVE